MRRTRRVYYRIYSCDLDLWYVSRLGRWMNLDEVPLGVFVSSFQICRTIASAERHVIAAGPKKRLVIQKNFIFHGHWHRSFIRFHEDHVNCHDKDLCNRVRWE